MQRLCLYTLCCLQDITAVLDELIDYYYASKDPSSTTRALAFEQVSAINDCQFV
jgi:hypothetical protein